MAAADFKVTRIRFDDVECCLAVVGCRVAGEGSTPTAEFAVAGAAIVADRARIACALPRERLNQPNL